MNNACYWWSLGKVSFTLHTILDSIPSTTPSKIVLLPVNTPCPPDFDRFCSGWIELVWFSCMHCKYNVVRLTWEMICRRLRRSCRLMRAMFTSSISTAPLLASTDRKRQLTKPSVSAFPLLTTPICVHMQTQQNQPEI